MRFEDILRVFAEAAVEMARPPIKDKWKVGEFVTMTCYYWQVRAEEKKPRKILWFNVPRRVIIPARLLSGIGMTFREDIATVFERHEDLQIAVWDMGSEFAEAVGRIFDVDMEANFGYIGKKAELYIAIRHEKNVMKKVYDFEDLVCFDFGIIDLAETCLFEKLEMFVRYEVLPRLITDEL